MATDNRIIGYETYTVTTTEYVRADRVTQATVTGTTADDVIVSGPDSGQYATSFRGTIHAGDGNDRVELNSVVMSNYGYSYNDGYQDWGVADHSTSSMAVSNHYDRGLGAWIDLGAGDDVAYGTEA
ncbi:hypothetical protein FKK32_30545, partial [Klebsiella pneumoniae]|nr:hypothetical protein [Klebsiella pneumoniae]